MSSTIAAIATGNSAAGISVIRISGSDAISIANKVFKPSDKSSLLDLKGYRAKFGNIVEDGKEFDEAVALVYRAPKSFTGEDVVELSVHGGIFITEKTLKAVFAAGAKPAEAGEFTKRAFLNGKIDLTQAESIASIISASGEESAKASFYALKGALSNKINAVLEELISCSASMAAWVDYPDEEIPELSDDNLIATLKNAKSTLAALLDNYEEGQTILEGVDTAIVGKPNVGKSTLMNLLTGKEKSIVTQIAGTTRDIVEEKVRLGNLVLHLSDTAGLRESSDIVESIGIQRAFEKIKSASLVLAVFDSSLPLEKEDYDLIEKTKGKNAVAIINKSDLESKLDEDFIEKSFDSVVHISAKDGSGYEELKKKVTNILGVAQFDSSSAILANERQRKCCVDALHFVDEALVGAESGITFDAINVMIDSAVDELLSLTGKKATEEVVNNIFSRFCVGK